MFTEHINVSVCFNFYNKILWTYSKYYKAGIKYTFYQEGWN